MADLNGVTVDIPTDVTRDEIEWAVTHILRNRVEAAKAEVERTQKKALADPTRQNAAEARTALDAFITQVERFEGWRADSGNRARRPR